MASSSSMDKLPAVMLSSILQLLPAKELCRLRAVCKSWRSATIDPAFIKAHAARHSKEPLFITKFRDDETHVSVMDLSGNVVKRIAGADGGHQVLRTRLDLACLATITSPNTCRILSPATKRIQVIPPLPVPGAAYVEGVQTMCEHDLSAAFGLGLDASTGEYKLLRLRLQLDMCQVRGRPLLYEAEVLTINGAAVWRPRAGAQFGVIDTRGGVVFDGVVYFFSYALFNLGDTCGIINAALYSLGIPYATSDARMSVYRILSFDLAREEWRRDLPGPLGVTSILDGNMLQRELTLADLKGTLVLAHHPWDIMDLWFLRDFESALWVKEYSIQTESVTSSLTDEYKLMPLLELDDGRLVIHLEPMGLLLICDPGTNTFTTVDMGDHRVDSISVYTGSLLTLHEGGAHAEG